MKLKQMQALFTLAGIPVLGHWELSNGYWPDAYVEERKASPWWLVKTPKGLITIGWRKRVISIDWVDTPVRKVVTEDDVTKSECSVHAWSYIKALEYLTTLAHELTANTEVSRGAEEAQASAGGSPSARPAG